MKDYFIEVNMKILQVLVLILGLVIFAEAQKEILSGTVYDPNGAVIPDVKVTAVNQKSEKFEAVTNEEGFYELTLSYTKEYESPSTLQTSKYEIIFDKTNWGFKKLVVKNYLFIGRMKFDIALDANNPEPCGYSGADCLHTEPISTKTKRISDKISQRPLNKTQRKQKKTNKEKRINK